MVILWDKKNWNGIDIHQGFYILSNMLESVHEYFRWCFTRVYGPHTNLERAALGGTCRNERLEVILTLADRYEHERTNCNRRQKQ